MAKSEGQKMKLFVLKDILERETDATHGITMARILELLSMRGIKAERKSWPLCSPPMRQPFAIMYS